MRTFARLTSLAAAAPALLASFAPADVTNSTWSATSQFYYRMLHMPDIDQRREGLRSWGSMYCVPTATINVCAYAANHGFSGTYPFAGNWQSQSKFNDATAAIAFMGAVMSTDESTGTGGNGTVAGLNFIAAQSSNLLYIKLSKSDTYTPTVAKMAKLGCEGWAMAFAYGRYHVFGSSNGYPVVDRDGGHAVSLNRVQRSGSFYELKYRDPATDGILHSQSEFSNKVVYPVTYTAYHGSVLRGMNAIAHPHNDGVVRIVDSYWGVRPLWGMRFTGSPNLLGETGGTIATIDPTPFEGSQGATLPQFNISSFTILEDLAIHPEMTDALVLTRSVFNGQPTLLRTLDLVTGEMATLTGAPTNLVELAPSREGYIYSFDSAGTLFRLTPEGESDAVHPTVPNPTSICFDDSTDRLSLLSVPERRIAKYGKALDQIQNYSVPTSVPMSGDGSVRVDPTTGKAWFKTDASTLLYNVEFGGAGPTITTITPLFISGGLNSFQFGDKGEIYLMGDSITRVMKKSGGTWVEDTASPFSNGPGGTRLVMAKSYTNEDPATHDTYAWRTIPVEDVVDIGEDEPDCNADLNGDDLVNGADLGLLLAKWGTAGGAADINQSGLVDGADLGDLLSAWGDCL